MMLAKLLSPLLTAQDNTYIPTTGNVHLSITLQVIELSSIPTSGSNTKRQYHYRYCMHPHTGNKQVTNTLPYHYSIKASHILTVGINKTYVSLQVI